MTVTFFGHKDTPETIQPKLEAILVDLIQNRHADLFYVGNHGNFDAIVRKTLMKLKKEHFHIRYAVVLAYFPQKQSFLPSETIYPEGMEQTPRRFAICKRNQWMLEQADLVLTYVRRPFGGAAKFKELSEKRKKDIINLAEF